MVRVVYTASVAFIMILNVLLLSFETTSFEGEIDTISDRPKIEDIVFLNFVENGISKTEKSNSIILLNRYTDFSKEILARIPFGSIIYREAVKYKIDPLLIAAIIKAESVFDKHAVSKRGAIGLMQILPSLVSNPERLYDPSYNIGVGVRYFSYLLGEFSGNIILALAAYNAGPNAVKRFGTIPPYKETRNYIRKVLEYHSYLKQLEAQRIISTLDSKGLLYNL